jgi:glycosyltransferase involved in cell wall biosynthesis
MRLGLIARADRSGLGVQSLEAFRALQPDKVLVINVGHLADATENCNKVTDLSLYPGAVVHNDWQPNRLQLQTFLSDLDTVLSFETFYSDELPTLAKQRGVKTVLQPNFEFLRPWAAPDLWAAPSLWRYSEIPERKIHLPVPIATDRFTTREFPATAGNFLHVVGRPAVHDRNGTTDLLDALQHVTSEITVTVRCQNAAYITQLLSDRKIPSNVKLRVDASDVKNYWDLYTGDVLIMPRRYGGLCLPVNEALGSGMPVIMPDISPNNTWLPSEWLTPAQKTAEFLAMNRVDVFESDPVSLASKIDQFATDSNFYSAAKTQAAQLAKSLSWDELKPLYQEALAG